MKTIVAYIESQQTSFSKHPFFNYLSTLKTLDDLSCFVPELTFWAMTFQDILRINEQRVSDPFLKKIARHHRLEDAGHDKWFLEDKQYFSKHTTMSNACDDDSVAWLYGKEFQIIRDAVYTMIGEIYKIDNDILNVVLLLTLEATGHVFFTKVAAQVKKTGQDKALKYFSTTHLEVEMAHAIFEEAMERKLFQTKLSLGIRRKAFKLIDTCIAAFITMFDAILLACQARQKAKNLRTNHDNLDPRSHQTM